MKKIIYTLLFIFPFSGLMQAQEKTYFEFNSLDKSSIEQINKEGSKAGWIIIKSLDEKYLVNYTNPEYSLFFGLNCEDKNSKPYYIVEYTAKYGDGDFEGIDFISSLKDDYEKVDFIVDDVNFENPFNNSKKMKPFQEVLSTGKVLTINVYYKEIDEFNKNAEPELIRSMKFKIQNNDLVKESVKCF